MKIRKRIRVWWRTLTHLDPTMFPQCWNAALRRHEWYDRQTAWNKREYVRRMSGGYPTGEKP